MKDRVKFLICIIIVIILGAAIYFYKLEFIKNEEKNATNNSQIKVESNEETANEGYYDKNALNTDNEELENNTVSQTDNNTSTGNELTDDDSNIHLVKSASPSGFAGSSLHVIRLYSDGSVYLITYDGEGFNDSNIGSNELIATNAEDIQGIPYKEGYENSKNIEAGTVIIKGKNLNVIDDGYGWMRFEK